MTPFVLNGKDARTMHRDLFTYDDLSSRTSYPAKKPHLTRLVEPSRYGTTYASETYTERLPSWFTACNSFHHTSPPSYSPSYSYTAAQAEAAHRSLAYDLSSSSSSSSSSPSSHTSHAKYTNAYTSPSRSLLAHRIKTREAEYAALLLKKKEEKEKMRVQRRGEELLFVRSKARSGVGAGWRREEREVEWVRGRWV